MTTWWGQFSEITLVPLFGKHVPMSTALFFQYTPSGFVIAADGRSTKEDTLEIISDSVQKIFQIGGPGRRLGYAMTGALKLGLKDGGTINLADEAVKAIESLSKRKTKNIYAFASRMCNAVCRAVSEANRAGKIAQLPIVPQPERIGEKGHTIIRTVIAGYFEGTPVLVETRISHENGVVREPEIIHQPLQETWMSGVPEVARNLFKQEDVIFAAYRPFVPEGRYWTLAETVTIARQFITACSSTEAVAVNPQSAKGIGGRILIATITPHDGFRWVDGHGPLSGQANSSDNSQM